MTGAIFAAWEDIRCSKMEDTWESNVSPLMMGVGIEDLPPNGGEMQELDRHHHHHHHQHQEGLNPADYYANQVGPAGYRTNYNRRVLFR